MSGEFLSRGGRRRMVEMGVSLKRAVVRRRRARTTTRAVAGVLLLVGIALVWQQRTEPAAEAEPRVVERHAPKVPSFEHFAFEVVDSGPPDRLASWVVRDTDVSRFLVTDGALSGLLAESGHGQGFMRIGRDVSLLEPLAEPAGDE